MFLFCVEKSSDYEEDVDASKLHGSAPLHPDRCTVMASLSIKILIFFFREGYPKTLLQAHIQKTPENVSSEPKLKILRRFWMRKWPVLSRFRSFQILLSPFLIFLLQLLTQPRSQGLSSYCPLGQAKRDPGWVWSHATLTIENIRERSSVIRQFVMLSFVKALRCDCHF